MDNNGGQYPPSPKRLKLGNPVEEAENISNQVEEPSPLGLKLSKTTSLMELIQASLLESDNVADRCTLNNHEPSPSAAAAGSIQTTSKMVENGQQERDKRKATNFPAMLLKIGTWERSGKYEGELVVKCYFAKRKLVWEVLEGGLKRKIEVQWSDICAIRASCPRHGPGTLEIQLSRPPLFYKESNPQPRKHTLWQASSDFTDDQATMSRKHVLKFAQGVLDKHYAKLLEADPRLNALSKKPFISGDRPFHHHRTNRDHRVYWSLPNYSSSSNCGNFKTAPGSSYGPSTSSSSAFAFSLQTMVPVFDHFNPEEKIKSLSCCLSNQTQLQEFADDLLNFNSLPPLQDPMKMLNVNARVPCIPQVNL